MANEFDLDVTFDDADPDLSRMSDADLRAAIAALPDALRAVAQGLLVDKRTMSDVSQDLGIRQSDLVTRLHRAKQSIAESL
jgi:DNA-directed RNA polymerase specialized sigma24 family protein